MEQTKTKVDYKKVLRDRKLNRWFYIIFFALILGSVIFTFNRIVILKDYQIVAETSCEPQNEESCFVREEEVTTTTPDGLEATTTETTFYKMISKKAADIYICEKTESKDGCNEELTCTEGEKDCSYEYCSDENVPEGESCSSSTTTSEPIEDKVVETSTSTREETVQ
ncbi:MAG: hypothetical protein WCO30_01655 [bacterium]